MSCHNYLDCKELTQHTSGNQKTGISTLLSGLNGTQKSLVGLSMVCDYSESKASLTLEVHLTRGALSI